MPPDALRTPRPTTARAGATYAPPAPPADACPSCGAARPGRYCGACGEARVAPDDLTLRAFLAHAFEQFTSVDGTLWRTVRTLLFRPGQLTVDWLAGRRRGTAKPLQLFVLANLAFFLITSVAGNGFRYRLAQYEHGRVGSIFLTDTAVVQAMVARRAAERGVTREAYATRFDDASAAQQSVWLLLAPTVALALAVLYARRRLPIAVHLVFAVHFLALLLGVTALTFGGGALLATGSVALARAAGGEYPALFSLARAALRVANSDVALGIPAFALILTWLFRALRAVHPEPWPWTLGRTVLLALALPRIFDAYRDLLFVVTLWGT